MISLLKRTKRHSDPPDKKAFRRELFHRHGIDSRVKTLDLNRKECVAKRQTKVLIFKMKPESSLKESLSIKFCV